MLFLFKNLSFYFKYSFVRILKESLTELEFL